MQFGKLKIRANFWLRRGLLFSRSRASQAQRGDLAMEAQDLALELEQLNQEEPFTVPVGFTLSLIVLDFKREMDFFCASVCATRSPVIVQAS
jgi:hypothetical protein